MPASKHLTTLVLAAALGLSAAACSQHKAASSKSRDSTRSQRDRVANSRIPRDARRVSQGRGELSYRASRDGHLFVVDANTDATVYDGPIRAGEQFVLTPAGNKATIDGHRVLREDLKKDDQHEIYFAPD